MESARRIVALGRAARNAAAIKTRQPLREVVVVLESEEGDSEFREGARSLESIVLEELNVKSLRFGEAEDIVAYDLKPNLGVVGPKHGKLVPSIRSALAEASPETGKRAAAGEEVTVSADGQEITLSPDELLVESGEREGYALARDRELAVALSTELNPDLLDEGLIRELVHKVQNLRRERGFEIEASVSVSVSGNRRVRELLEGRWGDYFKAEVLARDLDLDGGASGGESLSVDGEEIRVKVEPLG